MLPLSNGIDHGVQVIRRLDVRHDHFGIVGLEQADSGAQLHPGARRASEIKLIEGHALVIKLLEDPAQHGLS
jgi:hypothetical protein